MEFSKGISANSCVVFDRDIWDSFSLFSSRGDGWDADGDHCDCPDMGRGQDLDPGREEALVAVYLCNEPSPGIS
jgi:hypothetical protein